MALATFFAVLGYVFVFTAHFVSGESEIALGERSSSRIAHVALGYVALCWLAVQTAAGVLKALHQNETKKSFTWHGTSGKYLLLFAYVTSTLGFWLRMNYANQEKWAVAFRVALTGGSLLLFGWRLFPPAAYPPHGIDEKPTYDDDDNNKPSPSESDGETKNNKNDVNLA
mmetsp:Transcript_4022/g.13119  ORF Transcript_4022/g.13119 Transcript_4022/m.13119 type:complete len:170 (+) Transcript_4022:1024-1533(+)